MVEGSQKLWWSVRKNKKVTRIFSSKLFLDFNIVYKLSNAIFLSPSIIMHLKKEKFP